MYDKHNTYMNIHNTRNMIHENKYIPRMNENTQCIQPYTYIQCIPYIFVTWNLNIK